MEARAPQYENIVNPSSGLLQSSDSAVANTLRNVQTEVKRAWEEITAKTAEEGKKLEQALEKATRLHGRSSAMFVWFDEITEETVIFETISVVFEKVEEQRNKFKVC